MSLSLVITTLSTEAEARRLASRLVEERLAACVQIVTCESHYIFEGKQEAASEWRLEIKTSAEGQAPLMARLQDLHPYDVPELVALPIAAASDDYAAWVRNAVGPVSE
ncbi:MAG: divalent-cation tolerance protein CutA [Pseudomonadota bacterium]